FFGLIALLEALPLRPQPFRRLVGQVGRLGLLQSLLHFEHFREKIHRHLGLHRRLFSHLTSLFEVDQVLDPLHGVAERSIRSVHERRSLERAGLLLRPRPWWKSGW